MKCLTCSRMQLQAHPAYAAVGFGHCPLDGTGVFVSLTYERACKSFAPASPDVVAERVKWNAKRVGGMGAGAAVARGAGAS